MVHHGLLPGVGEPQLKLNPCLATAAAALSLVVCLSARESAASALDFDPATPTEILLAQRSLADSATAEAPGRSEAAAPVGGLSGIDPVAAEGRPKSPGKGFLYSVLIPGAGHLYAGEKRGLANLGLEAATWVAYLYYHDRGKSKEDEFEAFADAHWDYDRWIASEGGRWAGSPQDSIIQYFAAHNRQQYYEEIGKLSPYWSGWDDYTVASGDGYNRNYYRGIRADSNNFLRNARYAVVGGFVNRAVSAVDVLRLLKNRGRANLGRDTSLRFRVRTKPFSSENAFGFELKKKL